MGFRLYLGKVSKKRYEKQMKWDVRKIKNKLPNKFCTTIYELGKDFEYGSRYNLKPYFEYSEVNEYYNDDNVIYLGDEKLFLDIIEYFRNEIYTQFKELKKDEIGRIGYINFRVDEWKGEFMLPYNLGKRKNIVNSDKYEYAIFELVKIYREFDFKKHNLVFYGW